MNAFLSKKVGSKFQNSFSWALNFSRNYFYLFQFLLSYLYTQSHNSEINFSFIAHRLDDFKQKFLQIYNEYDILYMHIHVKEDFIFKI